MNGPTSPEPWKNTTRLIHSQLGLPESLEHFGVYHAYLDARQVERAL